MLFERLDPATLGKVIALQEHKVIPQNVLWGINAYGQCGVELGKKLGEQLIPAVQDPARGHSTSPYLAILLVTIAKVEPTDIRGAALTWA